MVSDKYISVKFIEKNCIRNTRDFHLVSHDRWQNAVACFNNGDYFASLYLAGYSVECILKYAILETLFTGQKVLSIRQLIVEDGSFRPLGEHKLNKLMELGDQKDVFKVPKETDFAEIVNWTSEWRYSTENNIDKELAKKFLQNVVRLSEQLSKELKGKLKINVFEFAS